MKISNISLNISNITNRGTKKRFSDDSYLILNFLYIEVYFHDKNLRDIGTK